MLDVSGDVAEKVCVGIFYPCHLLLIPVFIGSATGPGDPVLQALPAHGEERMPFEGSVAGCGR